MLHKLLEKYEVVLGRSSPRRKELLEQMGLDFKLETRNKLEHHPPDLSPAETAFFKPAENTSF
jgi:predicted house-cleaning NTP pyrophosphatase (Maf/HAM1 superfamily)